MDELRDGTSQYLMISRIPYSINPCVSWINPYQVEKLLGKFPLRVRWFDSRAEEVSDPQGIGWYTALVEGVSPDGITIRRSERFYCSAEGKGTVVQRITGTEEGWRPRSSLVESGPEEQIIQLLKHEPDRAVAVSFLAERRKETERPILPPGKHAQSFDRLVNRGQSCLYWLYLPEEYGKKNQKWPMILFLHGSSQQGRDLSRIGTPIPPNIGDIKNDFPFVVVTPQCPDEFCRPVLSTRTIEPSCESVQRPSTGPRLQMQRGDEQGRMFETRPRY